MRTERRVRVAITAHGQVRIGRNIAARTGGLPVVPRRATLFGDLLSWTVERGIVCTRLLPGRLTASTVSGHRSVGSCSCRCSCSEANSMIFASGARSPCGLPDPLGLGPCWSESAVSATLSRCPSSSGQQCLIGQIRGRAGATSVIVSCSGWMASS